MAVLRHKVHFAQTALQNYETEAAHHVQKWFDTSSNHRNVGMLPEASENNAPTIGGCTRVHPYNPVDIEF